MKRAIFITHNNFHTKDTGGMQCTARNYEMISEFYETDVYIVKCEFVFKLLSIVGLYYPTITFVDKYRIAKKVKDQNYDLVFFDSSIFGIIIRYVKKLNKNLEIITFFQNVELDYITVRFGQKIRKYPYNLFAWYNERLALKNSNKTIVLSQRDKDRLMKIYGVETNFILPITFDDVAMNTFEKTKTDRKINSKPFILFVGSFIFSNFEAINCFVNNVMPSIKGVDLLIVGKNFELKKQNLERPNVHVIGTVDNLSDYYVEAECVITPIFNGAGMKVKVAEALMYGKIIFGTKEAFEGYNLDDNSITVLCNDSKDFIDSLNIYLDNPNRKKYNPKSRELYEKYYSSDVARKVFENILR